MGKINHELTDHLRRIFKDEYDDYIHSLDQPLSKSILLNSDMTSDDLPFTTWSNPFSSHHYRFDPTIHLSDYALYFTGAFYGQEASAASAVEILDPQKGECVIDCCAAPGGKSLQIASRIGKSGLLVSNEYDAKRAMILAGNIENFGLTNTIVTQGSVDRLRQVFDHCFDKVLVDAPCSGEGMFKKESVAIQQWSIDLVHHCAKQQSNILDDASHLVKAGGILVYSTCTFAIEENEATILHFLKTHHQFQLEPIDVTWGRKGFDIDADFDLTQTRRIFPMDGGEGHFIAKLKRIDGVNHPLPIVKPKQMTTNEKNMIKPWYHGNLDHIYKVKDRLIYTTSPYIDPSALRVIYRYLSFGTLLKNRIEPAFALSHCNDLFDHLDHLELSIEQVNAYLHGLTIETPLTGWLVATYYGKGLGWIKSSASIGKNHYPKSRRIHHTVI